MKQTQFTLEHKLSGLTITITIKDRDALSDADRAFMCAAMKLEFFPPAANAPVIAYEDRPDVGREPAATVDVVTLVPAPEQTRDFTKVFGSEASTPSVTIPPPPSVAMPTPTPPAMPVPTASLPASAPAAIAVVPLGGGGELPALGALPALDSAHFPWDSRIHAGTKARNADGTWRKRKSLDPALVIAVEADLRAVQNAPRGEPGATPAQDDASTFPKLMAWIAANVAAGKLPQSATFDVARQIGLMSVVSLKDRPDLLPAAHSALVARMAELAESAEAVTA